MTKGFMHRLAILAMFLGVLPLAAQETPQDKPQDNQQQTQQQKPPVLETPKLAEPEEAPAETPAAKPATPSAAPAVKPGGGKVVEEIIARVNNEIISNSEYLKARASSAEDAKQDCNNRCTPEQLQTAIQERQKNTLRDLIDQSLLEQRGKDMGISVETDVIKRLDQIRIQNNLDSMEALEKAVTAQGINWEDFKNNIRNGILTQRVVSQEVGSHITIGHDEIQAYYDQHKQDFVRPEQVALREIEISTEGKSPAETAELKKKAETALQRVKNGEDFGEIAKRYSDGATAKQGGYLGMYKRGELAKSLEDTVFALKKNDLTGVIETKQGFLVLQVMEHYDQGLQPLPKVENEIMDKLYTQRMEPALREYLKTLREQSYVVVKPGYVDMAGGGNSEIQEVSAIPETSKKKKGHKRFLLFGKRSGE